MDQLVNDVVHFMLIRFDQISHGLLETVWLRIVSYILLCSCWLDSENKKQPSRMVSDA